MSQFIFKSEPTPNLFRLHMWQGEHSYTNPLPDMYKQSSAFVILDCITCIKTNPSKWDPDTETGVKDMACVFTIRHVWSQLFSLFSAQGWHKLLFNQMIHTPLQKRDNDSQEWLFCVAETRVWSNYWLNPRHRHVLSFPFPAEFIPVNCTWKMKSNS